jgi:pimeloyl-ACP methyl ester carboxylesterase
VARAIVVGVDFGAGVALRLAGTRRERVARQVLVNPVALDEFPGRDIRTLQRNTARFALRIARGLFGVAPLLTPLLEESVADREHMPPRLVGRYLAPYVGSEGVTHLLALARAMNAQDLEEIDLSEIRTPTLIVRGEDDPLVDRAATDRLAAAIADAHVLRLPGVGRLVPEEAPERLGEIIVEFSTAKSLV